MLKGKCFFPLIRLINKLELKDELQKLVVDVTGKTEEEKKAALNEKGFEFTFLMLSRVEKAETEIKEFISIYMEKSINEVLEMDMLDIVQILKNLFMDPKFQTFFQQAMKQMNMN